MSGLLGTLYTGMSGLVGYSQGLQDVGNNLTNVNTPGYKGTETQFSDLFDQESGQGGASGGGTQAAGFGLTTMGSTINFTQGTLNQTGNTLDVAISGNGFFVTRNGTQQTYTRAGQFNFNTDGFLVDSANGQRVAGLATNGQLQDISLTSLQTDPAKVTTSISFVNALSTTATADPTISGITVTDPAGGQHTLTLDFHLASANVWNVTVTDSTGATVGTGTITYANGVAVAGSSSISVSYAPAGVTAFPLTLDFSKTTSSALGLTSTASTIQVDKVDGNAAGALVSETFDSSGMLVAKYSNGQTVNGPHLAMAYFDSTEQLTEVSGNNFTNNDPSKVTFGTAGTGPLGSITAGSIEGSNVDLSHEFSNLIVMQRGYQAASQVLSTANDMIQTLFDMKKQ